MARSSRRQPRAESLLAGTDLLQLSIRRHNIHRAEIHAAKTLSSTLTIRLGSMLMLGLGLLFAALKVT